jgi:hypothetical protein
MPPVNPMLSASCWVTFTPGVLVTWNCFQSSIHIWYKLWTNLMKLYKNKGLWFVYLLLHELCKAGRPCLLCWRYTLQGIHYALLLLVISKMAWCSITLANFRAIWIKNIHISSVHVAWSTTYWHNQEACWIKWTFWQHQPRTILISNNENMVILPFAMNLPTIYYLTRNHDVLWPCLPEVIWTLSVKVFWHC